MRGRGAALAAAACLAALCACAPGATLRAKQEFARFGTEVRWVYAEEYTPDADAVWAQLTARSDAIEADVSTERAQSSVSRFNAAAAGERVPIGADAYQMLTVAQAVYAETAGAYNPATGLLVDLWGFSPRHRADDYAPTADYDRADYTKELPDARYLAAFSDRRLLDFGAVELGKAEDGYYAVKPEDAFVEVENAQGEAVTYTMQLNLSGIGKGYCADEGGAILRAAGVEYGYYNLGASSMLLLADPSSKDGVWKVGISSPREFSSRADYASLRARDTVLSTSGDYEQYYELHGVRYCHIIDPSTGYPVGASPEEGGAHIVCVTVAGGGAAEGDARATAISCMGRKEALAYCRAHSGTFRAVFVWYDGAGKYTVYSNLEEWTLNERSLRVEEIA